MRARPKNLCRIAVASVVVALAFVAEISYGRSANAQVQVGEFTLHQGQAAGWVCVSGDRTVEWWAYIDGVYQWGDSSSVGGNAWHLDAEYIGVGAWASYDEWKADVLQRSAAHGHTIVFQKHAVAEESVAN